MSNSLSNGAMAPTELGLTEVTAGYSGTDVLRGVSVAVAPGECVAVLGANGAGKSTLLRVLSGQLRVRSGRRAINGNDVTAWSAHRAARAGVRWTGEPRPIYPSLSVAENLEVGGVTARASIARRRSYVYELLPDLSRKASQRAASLSGGQQQMLAIGQALMSEPQYLCLDEPSLGLSLAMVNVVAELVSELVRSGVGVVWAEQFPEVALDRATKVIALRGGIVVARGEPGTISQDELEDAYMGRTTSPDPPTS